MNDRDRTIVYVAGPHWSPEEEHSLIGMAGVLERHGFESYLPHRDGIENLYWRYAAGARSAPRGVDAEDLLRRALFCMEVYQVVRRCGALVCTLNGRVPDEAAVFKAALAYAVGKPLVICKSDNRSAFHGNDNSMVTGLTPAFKTVKGMARLPAELIKAIRSLAPPPAAPGHLNDILDLGERIGELVEKGRGDGEGALVKRIAALRTELLRATGAGGKDGKRADRGIVYCSGPLFCPEELGVMADMARALEDAGCGTFLPQRDGVEAFVMNQVDSPLGQCLDIQADPEPCQQGRFRPGYIPDRGAVRFVRL